MPRFFVEKEQIDREAQTLCILGDDARHIARSLRMAEGDTLTVCGEGQVFEVCLSHIRDEEVEGKILRTLPADTEPPYELRLFMAYPKGDKLETVVQKAVELGATRITPFDSSRCVKRPPKEKQERLTDRLCRIAREAAGQCGRCRAPIVDTPITWGEMLREAKEADLPLFCYEGEGTTPLGQILGEAKAPRSVSCIVGSEGGFSQGEANEALHAGLIPTGLGKRILRCETAPLFALSVLASHYEE